MITSQSLIHQVSVSDLRIIALNRFGVCLLSQSLIHQVSVSDLKQIYSVVRGGGESQSLIHQVSVSDLFVVSRMILFESKDSIPYSSGLSFRSF